jgi:hypothetical protein
VGMRAGIGEGEDDLSAVFLGDVVAEPSESRGEGGRFARNSVMRVEVLPPNACSDRRL